MKRENVAVLILIFIVVACLIVFARAVCEDEDSALDMVCSVNDPLCSEELFADLLSCPGNYYELCDVSISPRSTMVYLERHEKSPPVGPAVSVTA